MINLIATVGIVFFLISIILLEKRDRFKKQLKILKGLDPSFDSTHNIVVRSNNEKGGT